MTFGVRVSGPKLPINLRRVDAVLHANISSGGIQWSCHRHARAVPHLLNGLFEICFYRAFAVSFHIQKRLAYLRSNFARCRRRKETRDWQQPLANGDVHPVGLQAFFNVSFWRVTISKTRFWSFGSFLRSGGLRPSCYDQYQLLIKASQWDTETNLNLATPKFCY